MAQQSSPSTTPHLTPPQPSTMANPSRRNPLSGQQEYAAIPTTPQAGGLHPNSQPYPFRNAAVGPRPSSTLSSQQGGSIVQGVTTGAIGAGYGPYSYAPGQRDSGLYSNSRFSTAASDTSIMSAAAEKGGAAFAGTSTVPAYLWDKDPDLDDALHTPDPVRDAKLDRSWTFFSLRGWLNATALFLVVGGLLMLFAGYPIYTEFSTPERAIRGFNLGGINGSGQIPDLPGLPSLIDKDTPEDVYTRTGNDGHEYELVFSDEFETAGRSFYPGDDPYWEAMDFHYWPTGDLEWYDPSAVTTEDGKLVFTMTEETIHDMNFKSGMLQTWNKFCFTTGYIEVSLSLPGSPRAPGLWPGVWTMGNLGRAGYGATTQGLWPYSYDTCDVGTLANQSTPEGEPAIAATAAADGSSISYLPGQRLSACTCPDAGDEHPGPRPDFGRAAPEIDIIEAQIDVSVWRGEVSQSFQLAPFDFEWKFDNSTSTTTVYDESISHWNTYTGSQLQQAASVLTYVDDSVYGGQEFATFGFEYWADQNNRDDGFITWYSQGRESWKVTAAGFAADTQMEISQRLIPEEPMYIILNLGMSPSFQAQDFEHMTFPSKMYVDYVRVYQRKGLKEALTCDPSHHPTARYIETHPNAYTNANWTTFEEAGYSFPQNSLIDEC